MDRNRTNKDNPFALSLDSVNKKKMLLLKIEQHFNMIMMSWENVYFN